MLFEIKDGQFYYENTLILKDLNLNLGEDDRVGLIGENGCGKTTLLNIITGKLILEKGTLNKKRLLSVGYLEQNSGLDSNNTVIEEMRLCFKSLLDMEKRMREIEQDLTNLEVDSIEYRKESNEYAELKKKFEGLDGYNVDVKIKKVLNGMGFKDLYDRNCSSFSGGEKTRLALAKLLLLNPELLILDEPTNHLDFSTLFWLEDYLKGYKGAILTVSHDRFFLDKIVNRIWEIENHQLRSWKGNYTKFRELKDEFVRVQTKEYEKQQVEIAHYEDFIARNRYQATKAKSAQDRIKKLEQMEIIEKPNVNVSTPTFVFEKELDPTKDVIKVENLDLSIGTRCLINDGCFLVPRGEKVGIIGDNGTGKSTLLNRILNSFGKYEKEIVFGKNISISYYDQENLNMNFDNQVRMEMWDKFPRSNEYEIRRALGRMLFTDEDMDKTIRNLSGGERAKLGFAIMMMKKSNLLVLDEPTNHIDLAAREALEKALIEFDGTILFVSHDRYLLSAVSTRIVEIKDEKIIEYPYSFKEVLKIKENESKKEEEVEKVKPNKSKDSSYRSSKDRAIEVKNKQEIALIEKNISEKESEIGQLEQEMLNPSVSSNYEKLKPILDRLEVLRKELDELYLKWEEKA